MGVRAVARTVSRLPAWVYQRQQAVWDRVILAAGWAGLYWLGSGVESWARFQAPDGSAAAASTALPVEWRLVMSALVFLLGLWKPVAGYAAFVVAVAYPLYQVSIYVMALALAFLILLAPIIAANKERGVLYLALLVLLTPALAPLHLAPLVPLLIGLWWQGTGTWVGAGLAALWLKLCAGMSGQSVDLWAVNGWTMTAAPLYERFHAASSLQTVARLLQPLGVRLAPLVRAVDLGPEPVLPAQAGVYTLYNLLQVLAWGAAAYVVSVVLDRLSLRWAGRRGWALSALSLGPGLLVIWAGYVALPAWLGIEGPAWFDPPWVPAQILWVGLIAWGLDGLLRYLHHPVSLGATDSARPYDAQGYGEQERVAIQHRSALPGEGAAQEGAEVEWPSSRPDRSPSRIGRRRGRNDPAPDQGADIMIELD